MQVVKQYLGSGGAVITAWQSDLKVDPSIWFRKGDDLYWVVVRWAPYPMKHAEKPSNIEDIKFACIDLGKLGFFASIIIANAQDSFDPSQDAMPLYRGHELRVKFEGLEPL